jgi:hypothetical protein
VDIPDHFFCVDGPFARTRAHRPPNLFGCGHNLAVDLSCFNDLFGRTDGDANGLFNQNVQTAFEQGNPNTVVEPVRQTDIGGFCDVGLDEGVDIRKNLWFLTLECGDFCGAFLGCCFADIATSAREI